MGEKDWNINKGFGDVLTDLIIKVNESAAEGNIIVWFNSLRILYRNIAGHKKMNKEKIEEINTDLKDIRKKLGKKDAKTRTGQAFIDKGESDVKDTLDDINIKIITEMHKAGLILPIYKKRADYGAMET